MNASKYHCPCCGFDGLQQPAYRCLGPPPWTNHGSPPYRLRYGEPSYEVCSCCGFEFGNDDEPGTASGISFEDYRREWLDSGSGWFCHAEQPQDWSAVEQLRRANITLAD